MKESTEFSYQHAPIGVAGNPLDGQPLWMGGLGDTRRPRKWWAEGVKEPLEGHELPRLENPGITDVGSSGHHWDNVPQAPEELLRPDPVSATDPAFSQHPAVLKIANDLAKVPASTTGGDSSWTQMKLKGPIKHLRRSELVSALGIPGLNLHYEDQGVSTIT